MKRSFSRRGRQGRRSTRRGSQRRYSKRVNSYRVARGGIRL